jgi:hypothetical protein
MNKRQERLQRAEEGDHSKALRSDAWIDQELGDCEFGDVRLGKRLRKLLQFSDWVGASIPMGLPGLGEH